MDGRLLILSSYRDLRPFRSRTQMSRFSNSSVRRESPGNYRQSTQAGASPAIIEASRPSDTADRTATVTLTCHSGRIRPDGQPTVWTLLDSDGLRYCHTWRCQLTAAKNWKCGPGSAPVLLDLYSQTCGHFFSRCKLKDTVCATTLGHIVKVSILTG